MKTSLIQKKLTSFVIESKAAANQTHPAISSNQQESHILAYKDDISGEILWGTMNGQQVSYDINGGYYPSLKHWNDSRFFGTFISDPSYHNGAAVFLFETTDPENLNTYSLESWFWDSYGWYNITDSEIACIESPDSFRFGYISFVGSSNYTDGINNSPHITRKIGENEVTLSWSNVQNCSHTDACFDTVSKKGYSIYDRFLNAKWQLFLRIDNFTSNASFVEQYDIDSIGNLTYPKIAVNNGNMVIVSETDHDGNKDIICIYNTPNNPQQVHITNSNADERFPEIEWIDDTTYICSFIKENILYYSISTNGGQRWSDPIKIRENVIEDYKSTDLSENIDYLGYEKANGSDIDVIFEDARQSFVFVDDTFDNTTPGWQYDHFNTIQDGINAVSENGTVFVYNGTYYENIILNKSISLVGENKNSTIINGDTTLSDTTIQIINEEITISQFTLTHDISPINKNKPFEKPSGKYGLYEGIVIENTVNNTIISNCQINNYTFDHGAGLWIYGNNNTITNCDFDNNAIILSDNNFGNNTIKESHFSNKSLIYFEMTKNNTILNNTFNSHGLLINGIQQANFIHTIQNNTLNNKPIQYIKHSSNFNLDNIEIGQLILVNCSNINILNTLFNYSFVGLEIACSSSISFNNCIFEENLLGSKIDLSENITVSNNNFKNGLYGLQSYLSRIHIEENNITKNEDGLSINHCTGSIQSNNIHLNNGTAIMLEQSINMTVSQNKIHNNNQSGILILRSDNNTIQNNSFKNNVRGISIQLAGNNNKIYHNTFQNNINNAIDYGNNNYDNGYPSGGNYWDDYNGSDTNGDGIGETPYYNIIGGLNQDDYPFIEPFGWLVELDINQSTHDRGFPIRHATDGDWAGAQQFITNKTVFTKAEIYLRKFGTPEFNLTIELRENAIDGLLIDTISIPADEVPSSWSWQQLDFKDFIATIDKDYFIIIPPAPSGVTTSFGYEWGYAFGNQYDDGSFWFTRDGGNLWRDLPTMYEFVFRTYGY